MASPDDGKRLKDSNDSVGCFCEAEVFYRIEKHELAIGAGNNVTTVAVNRVFRNNLRPRQTRGPPLNGR